MGLIRREVLSRLCAALAPDMELPVPVAHVDGDEEFSPDVHIVLFASNFVIRQFLLHHFRDGRRLFWHVLPLLPHFFCLNSRGSFHHPQESVSSSTGVHTSGISSFSICLLTEASSYLALVTYSFTSSSPEFLSSHSLSLRSLSSRLHWILATILCADLTYSSPLSFTAHRPSICLSSLGIPEEAAMETTQLRSECSVQSLYNSGSSSGPLPDTHRPSSKKHSLSLEYTTLVITTKSS